MRRVWTPGMVPMGPDRWALRLCNRCNAELRHPVCPRCGNPEFRLVEIPVKKDSQP